MSVTREEFEAYVDVQRSGITNMMDIRTVREITKNYLIEVYDKETIWVEYYKMCKYYYDKHRK